MKNTIHQNTEAMSKQNKKRYNKHSVDGQPYLSELTPAERRQRITHEAIQRTQLLLRFLEGKEGLTEHDKKLGYVTIESTQLLLANQIAYSCKKLFKESFII